jgi:hypothetical protein
MADKYEEKERFDGTKVKILVQEYAASPEEDRYQWRKNINFVNIGEESNPINRYLTTAERYFYSTDWFGSEKRKNPA